jgi:twitching motility protein PilU
MDITPFLKIMVEHGGSDMFFSVGARANVKIEGKTVPVGNEPLDSQTLKGLAYAIMDEEQKQIFDSTLELNMGFTLPDVGRFRANLYHQRGDVAMVIRHISDVIPSMEELGLPAILNTLILEKRGLVLVVGATGSGKSTTLASMIDHRNTSTTGHILTVEDPIEFIHQHKKSVVDQREVGIDTLSYTAALKNALREAPDVIMIGEVRDSQTMQHAIHYSETGHLCLATLHASNANQTLERIINFFPEEARDRALQDLALHTKAIISQRLVRGTDGKRVAAVEVLLNSPHIADLIEKGRIGEIKDFMDQGTVEGIQTFDNALYDLYKAGRINAREAVRNADSQHNVRMRIEFENPGTFQQFDTPDLTIGED